MATLKVNLYFDARESYNAKNGSKSQLSQLIKIKWQFIFRSASEKALVSLKGIIHIRTVFITRTYIF